MTKKTILISILTILLSVGCSLIDHKKKKDNPYLFLLLLQQSPNMKGNLGIDLKNAKNIFISSSAVSSAVKGTSNATTSSTSTYLNVQLSDGTLQSVSITGDKTGYVTKIYDTPSHVAFETTNVKTDDNKKCSMVLARKSDSKLFCIQTIVPSCGDSVSCYFPVVQSNSDGTKLFISNYTTGLYRLDIGDSLYPSTTKLADTNTDGQVLDMIVNDTGDVFVGLSLNNARTFKVFGLSGTNTIINTSSFTSCIAKGIGSDANNFYYTNPNTNSGSVLKLTSSAFGSSTYSASAYSAMTGNNLGLCSFGGTVAKTKDRIFMVFRPEAARNQFLEAYNSSGTSAIRTATALTRIDKILTADDYVIVQGQDASGNVGLERYSTASSSFTTILSAGTYTGLTVTVASNGNVTFIGTRASDTVKVLGRIAFDKTTVEVVKTGASITDVQGLN